MNPHVLVGVFIITSFTFAHLSYHYRESWVISKHRLAVTQQALDSLQSALAEETTELLKVIGKVTELDQKNGQLQGQIAGLKRYHPSGAYDTPKPKFFTEQVRHDDTLIITLDVPRFAIQRRLHLGEVKAILRHDTQTYLSELVDSMCRQVSGTLSDNLIIAADLLERSRPLDA